MDSQELTTRVRLVRCPICCDRLLLPELPDFKVYKCGGCGVVFRARNRVRNERRSEGLTIESGPVNQLLDHVSRDSESVSSVASMGEVRTRNQVRNERSEGLIIETAPVNELLDHVSRDSETVSSDASMGEVRARNQVRNERSESSIYETAPVNQSLDHASQDLGTGNSDVISASMEEVRARNQMMNGRSESFRSNKIAALGNQLVSSMSISHHTSSNGANDDYRDMLKQKIKANFEDWIFLIVSIILELLSAAFDQASSPSKSNYALIGMLFAIVAVITCICELIHKVKREGAKLGRWGMLWWFYHPPPSSTIFGTFPDILALVGAIPQCIFATVQYVYHSRHADNPINLCLWPIVFLFCLVGLRLIKYQNRNIAHGLMLTQISISCD